MIALLLPFVLFDCSPTSWRHPLTSPWVVAAGKVDVDGDGVPDRIRIETRDGCFVKERLPCAGCGDSVDGHFVAVVTLSKNHRIVSTPVADHPQISDIMSFPNKPTAQLFIGDYNGDGQPDFNLGQFANSVNWEYTLYTIHRDGSVEEYALDKPEIYVADDQPSTKLIEPIPGGMRFHDFANAGYPTGWFLFTCHWQADRKAFRCSSDPERDPHRRH